MDEEGEECEASRTVAFVNREYWVIRDDVMGGEKSHEVSVCWQFSPGRVEVVEKTGVICFVESSGVRLMLVSLPGRIGAAIEKSTGVASTPPSGWASFKGRDVPAPHVRFRLESPLPLSLVWLLFPCADGPVSRLRANRSDEDGGVIRLEVIFPGGRKDFLTFSPPESVVYDSRQ